MRRAVARLWSSALRGGHSLVPEMWLHQFYVSQASSPGPDFVVLDQPSQVNFPNRVLTSPGAEEEEQRLRDEDVDAVRKASKSWGMLG